MAEEHNFFALLGGEGEDDVAQLVDRLNKDREQLGKPVAEKKEKKKEEPKLKRNTSLMGPGMLSAKPIILPRHVTKSFLVFKREKEELKPEGNQAKKPEEEGQVDAAANNVGQEVSNCNGGDNKPGLPSTINQGDERRRMANGHRPFKPRNHQGEDYHDCGSDRGGRGGRGQRYQHTRGFYHNVGSNNQNKNNNEVQVDDEGFMYQRSRRRRRGYVGFRGGEGSGYYRPEGGRNYDNGTSRGRTDDGHQDSKKIESDGAVMADDQQLQKDGASASNQGDEKDIDGVNSTNVAVAIEEEKKAAEFSNGESETKEANADNQGEKKTMKNKKNKKNKKGVEDRSADKAQEEDEADDSQLMTLKEYDRLLAEKKKVLEPLKNAAGERKVWTDEDLGSMKVIGKKKAELKADEVNRKERSHEEKKAPKSMCIDEFLNTAGGERRRQPYDRQRPPYDGGNEQRPRYGRGNGQRPSGGQDRERSYNGGRRHEGYPANRPRYAGRGGEGRGRVGFVPSFEDVIQFPVLPKS